MTQALSSGSRVAFFGGSFDPPHLGHLAVARAAQSALRLDLVLFAPVCTQPLKPLGSTAGFEDRLAMTRLAIATDPGLAVSMADAPRPDGSPNFTLETLLTLRGQLPPGGELFCLMGADSFLGLRRWHRAAEIPFAASLIVASRPGESLDDLMAALPGGLTIHPAEIMQATEKQGLVTGNDCSRAANATESAGALAPEGCSLDSSTAADALSEKAIEVRAYLLSNSAGDSSPFYLLPGLEVEISATAIRNQIHSAAGQTPARALLPDSVSRYIRTHGLYR